MLAPIVLGNGLTVIAIEDVQAPVGNVYIISGVPALTPVTFPEPSTTAWFVLLLLHVPPVVGSVKDIVDPAHTAVVVAAIGSGKGLTVKEAVEAQPVGIV